MQINTSNIYLIITVVGALSQSCLKAINQIYSTKVSGWSDALDLSSCHGALGSHSTCWLNFKVNCLLYKGGFCALLSKFFINTKALRHYDIRLNLDGDVWKPIVCMHCTLSLVCISTVHIFVLFFISYNSLEVEEVVIVFT